MRFPRKLIALVLTALMLGAPPVAAQDDGPLPLRRLDMFADADMPGGDLGPIFDTTLQACTQNCLGRADCRAVTYNVKSRACFPKGEGASSPIPFVGAISGRAITTPPERIALAQSRATAAGEFMREADINAAREMAASAAAMYPPSNEEDPDSAASRAEFSGERELAIRLSGMLAAQRDQSADWLRLGRVVANGQEENSSVASRVAVIATNAYLRAEDDAEAARALSLLAVGYEHSNRGIESLRALRLANQLLPDDTEIAAAMQKAHDRFGMRVTGSETTGDSAPRFCVTLSRPLAASIDYADFLRLPKPDMAVSASGQQLCVSGLDFGQQVELTLRAGLPSGDGEKLARDVTVRGYVRDRAASVRFPGRAYVLPAGGDQGLSVSTINADTLDLTLLRLSDRNLLRVMAEGMFATPLDSWQAAYFNNGMATEVWHGKADVAKPAGSDGRNTELTTRLPIAQGAGELPAGIYILQANVAGENVDEVGVASQWFVISDFGISTYGGNDGLTVVVRSLATTGPGTGAEVALVTRANEVLARAVTDDQGMVHFPPGLSLGKDGSAPALITVTRWQGEGEDRSPADMAFLSLTDPEFDLSDRGVEGKPPAPPIDIFATTERGAYRVGETINATILARDGHVAALADLPLTAVFLRPDGVEQARVGAAHAGAGGHIASWTLPGNAPRGTWRIDIRAEADGPALASTRVLVEDFLPERIDFTPSLRVEGISDDAPARAGTAMDLSLDARWLFGAPAADLPVEGTLWLAPQYRLAGFEGYRFGRYDSDTQPNADPITGGQTDAQGHFTAQIELPEGDTLGLTPYDARLSVNVREGAGRPVEREVTRLIMPDAPVIGIRGNFDENTVPEGADARFQIVAVGPDLKPQDAAVKWTLNRIETRYEWYSLDGQWQWEATTERKQIAQADLQLTGGPAEIAVPVEWGSYELVVEGPDSAVSAVEFYAGWGAASAGSDTPDRLRVVLDKPAYRSGETAHVTVDAVADGTGIVAVLSSEIVTMQVVPLKAGENRIELPVTDEWGAGVYVTVSALRPLDGIQPGDRLPVRALGLAHAAVDPGQRALKASLEVPAEVRPRQEVPITLRVDGAASGETVYATVAAVDQGILNLTGFNPPDPSEHYFGQRRLGVGLRDMYGRLILPSGAPDGALRQGGDAQSMGSEAPPPTEKLLSWFSGPVTVAPDGTAQLSIPVGDFNGEIRVMAVAWSQTGVGQADATILSRDPVVMTVTAPAFLAPGDQAQIGLRLTHAAGPAGEVRLAIAQTGGEGAVDLTLPQDSITLAEKSEAQLLLPVTAEDRNGLVEMRLTLTTPDGTELTKDIALLVALNEPLLQRQDRVTVAPGSSLAIPAQLTQGLLPGADLSIAVGNYARLDVAGALARLQRYPYGCTEQMTSVALPLLYLPRLSQLEGVDDDTPNPRTVDEAVAEILTRQASEGAFGMWYASSGDLWLDAYVTDFLSRARALGHQVPDQAFDLAITNLRNRVNYATEPRSADAQENAALAYAVAVLARERAAAIGDLRYYADTAAEAFVTPMSAANLGSALAAYGDQARADRMFRQANDLLNSAKPETRGWRSDYGTQLRDMAAVLALAAEAKTEVIDLKALTNDVAERIARQQEEGVYRSTQELVWSVLAANSLSQEGNTLTLNGAAMESPVAHLDADAALANAGTAPVEVTLTASGQPATSPAAGGNGYAITREYYNLDGAPVDPSQVAVGTRLVAVITVTPSDAEGGQLIVTDPLPAGFEIDNPNLLQSGDINALNWLNVTSNADMTEFRSDRFAAALYWATTADIQLAYMLRAVTPGSFRHPAASVEDMYRPEFRAWTDGGHVVVSP